MTIFSRFTTSIVNRDSIIMPNGSPFIYIFFLIQIELKSESNGDVLIFCMESNFYADYNFVT